MLLLKLLQTSRARICPASGYHVGSSVPEKNNKNMMPYLAADALAISGY